MSDNIAVTPGSGAVVAAEACSGTANALVQRIKLVLGATDTDGGNVSSANPMPVLSGTAGNFLVSASGTVTAVSGTAANLLVQASGAVTALSGTAANLLCTVTQGSSVTVISGTAANLLASVVGTVGVNTTVVVSSGTAASFLAQIQGSKTNNNAVPGATNVGALVAIANAAAVTYTEGDQVLLSTDLSGNVRVTGSLSVGGTTDEGTFSPGTSTGTPAMGYYSSTTASVGSGQTAVVAIDKWRHLQSSIIDSAGNARGVNVTSGNALLVDASATVQPVLSGTAANFLTTSVVSCGTASTMLVTALVSCGTASTLLAQVSQGTAGNLLATVNCGTAANFLTTSTVSCGTAGNMLVTALVSCGTASTLLTQVSQGTASNLLALVTVTAGTNQIGQVISGQQMSIYNGTAALTVNYTAVNFTASAGNTIVAAVANKNVYILSGLLIVQNATNLQWFSGTTAGTAVSGVMCMTANEGYQIPYVPIGNFATLGTNAAITLSSSVATTVGGWVTYVAF